MRNIKQDLKIIVVGNAGTGKTSFVNKWTKNVYNENYKATIVSEFGYKIHEHKGKSYRIQLWDLAGQDKNTGMTKIFCKDSHGVVILSDITNSSTLQATANWKKVVDDNVTFFDGSPLPMMLIQNKIDLIEAEERNFEALQDFSNRNGYIKCYQTSVKLSLNVVESMTDFIGTVIDKTEDINDKDLKKNDRNSIILSSNNQVQSKSIKKKCC